MPSILRFEKDGIAFTAFLTNLSCAYQFIGEEGVLLKDICEAHEDWMQHFNFLGCAGIKNAVIRATGASEPRQSFQIRDLDSRNNHVLSVTFSEDHRITVLKAQENKWSESAFQTAIQDANEFLKAMQDAEERAKTKRALAEREARLREQEIDEEAEERSRMYGRAP
jgi:hypothetical protein